MNKSSAVWISHAFWAVEGVVIVVAIGLWAGDEDFRGDAEGMLDE
jgi:hypothetical protein